MARRTSKKCFRMCSASSGTFIQQSLSMLIWLETTLHHSLWIRWRVKFMEESIKLLDFETVDQMVQIHGKHNQSLVPWPLSTEIRRQITKAWASSAEVLTRKRQPRKPPTSSKHITPSSSYAFPSFLVFFSSFHSSYAYYALTVYEVFHQRTEYDDMGLLAL